jgi:hypothetical protein
MYIMGMAVIITLQRNYKLWVINQTNDTSQGSHFCEILFLHASKNILSGKKIVAI